MIPKEIIEKTIEGGWRNAMLRANPKVSIPDLVVAFLSDLLKEVETKIENAKLMSKRDENALQQTKGYLTALKEITTLIEGARSKIKE